MSAVAGVTVFCKSNGSAVPFSCTGPAAVSSLDLSQHCAHHVWACQLCADKPQCIASLQLRHMFSHAVPDMTFCDMHGLQEHTANQPNIVTAL